MKRLLAVATAALLFGVSACGESHRGAKKTVEGFMERVMEKDGAEAVKLLHPTYRDKLSKDLRSPIELVEISPLDILASALSALGDKIESVKVKEEKKARNGTASFKVEVEDKKGVKRLFTFVLVKEDGRWMIADITPYAPNLEDSKD